MALVSFGPYDLTQAQVDAVLDAFGEMAPVDPAVPLGPQAWRPATKAQVDAKLRAYIVERVQRRKADLAGAQAFDGAKF